MEQTAPPSEATTPTDDGAPTIDVETGAGTPSTTAPTAESNWRSAMAGDDESFAEDLSNYKNLADVGALLREQRAALSERPKLPTLPEDATEEQLADYREALGIPDAASEYDYPLPDEYEPSELEQELTNAFLDHAHEKHIPATHVKESLEFFYKAQQASDRAANAVDLEKQAEWQDELKDTLGDSYTEELAAGEAYLNKEFAENLEAKDELLNARLPGGGRVGDSPTLIKLVLALARAGNAASQESAEATQETRPGGIQQSQERPVSLADRQAELEQLQFSNPRRYRSAEVQAELEQVIGARAARGELNWLGEPVRKRKAAQ